MLPKGKSTVAIPQDVVDRLKSIKEQAGTELDVAEEKLRAAVDRLERPNDPNLLSMHLEALGRNWYEVYARHVDPGGFPHDGNYFMFLKVDLPAWIEQEILGSRGAYYRNALQGVPADHQRRLDEVLGTESSRYYRKATAEAITQGAAGGLRQAEQTGDMVLKPEKAASAQPATVANGADRGGASWQAIEISFLSDERVQIRNGTKTATYNYEELGFADRRNGKPDLAWMTLRVLAEERGIIRDAGKTGVPWRKVEKRMQEIRRVLRKHFGIDADPVPLIKDTGYRALFKIGCNPSFDT
jgi:hypothetical protein